MNAKRKGTRNERAHHAAQLGLTKSTVHSIVAG